MRQVEITESHFNVEVSHRNVEVSLSGVVKAFDMSLYISSSSSSECVEGTIFKIHVIDNRSMRYATVVNALEITSTFLKGFNWTYKLFIVLFHFSIIIYQSQ